MHETVDDDAVWKALADPTRRMILENLEGSPVTTGGVVEQFSGRLVRTAVMKHLDILTAANLVRVERVGRTRYNHFEPAPLEKALHWLEKRARVHSENLGRLKRLAESRSARRENEGDQTSE